MLDAGARIIHIDVMDGRFVPPITIGPVVVDALRDRIREAGAHQQVHLMIEDPERQVDPFIEAGADGLIVHFEATPHVHRVLGHIRSRGVAAGVAITPGTPSEALGDVRDLLDVALCMTVNPGWGGQPFIEGSIAKIARLRGVLGPDVPIEVDGGVDGATAPRVVAAGAELLVAGSAVFGADDPVAAYREIRDAAGAT